MRLIDADALIKAVEDFPNCYNGWSDAYDKAFIIGAIEETPTIDAVSVVQADRKTENCSEIPNNFDKDTNVRSKEEGQTERSE